MSPTLHIPPLLQPGDLLYVIAPSGPLRELDKFEQGLAIWRSRGYQLKLCAGFDGCWGHLAGLDEQRREQLSTALKDPQCRGILCARGGYGGARLLEDWSWPAVEPKWLIGFSDITSLLWSWNRQDVSGVHGPLLTTLAEEPDWSLARLFAWVERRQLPPLRGEGWGDGTAIGRLLPGNLTVATHLLGTAVEPSLEGAILAFEDVGEAPYRVDRMLTQWRMMGKFQGVKGIALGRFSQWEPAQQSQSLTIDETLQDRLGDLGIPVVSQLPFGHDGVNATLPVGIQAQLDGDTGELAFPDFQ